MQKGLAVDINGDGEQTRDFIYVKDVADALQSGVTKIPKKIPWLVSNIGMGLPTSILDLRREMVRFFPDAERCRYSRRLYRAIFGVRRHV